MSKVKTDLSVEISGRNAIRIAAPDGRAFEIVGPIDFINDSLDEILSGCPTLTELFRTAFHGISEEELTKQFGKVTNTVSSLD